jgi:DNA-binding NtrC family response regulator
VSEREGRVKRFSPAALARLVEYAWPGNVRELRNVVQRAYVMAHGDVIEDVWLPYAGAGEIADLPPRPVVSAAASPALAPVQGEDSITLPIGVSMAQAERALIHATLKQCKHQKERTAAILGISLKTLYNRLKEYAADDVSPR